MKLFGTMAVKGQELTIGGLSVRELADRYGTPLYVMDEQLIRETAQIYTENFRHPQLKTGVIYASKAFLNIAMARLAAELGLGLDVVSGGELATALRADFPTERLYFHGNNKLPSELAMALEAGVGTLVLDNRQEAERFAGQLAEAGKRQRVLLRLNPGIRTETHDYIQTAALDSKFGESIADPEIFSLIRFLVQSPVFDLTGFHCHIGSQIFDEARFFETARVMLDFARRAEQESGLTVRTLNLGGGFGVYYTAGDRPLELGQFLRRYLDVIETERLRLGLGQLEILIEPGRSLISNAGTTLYTIGGTKQTVGGRKYIFIDGGMTDNPRPALYQAEYEAAIANRMDEPADQVVTVAGKCCESGDVIIRDIALANAEPGDLLAVASTGAYNFSMSSNYNRNERPAVVFVHDQTSRLAVRRQTYEDLLAQDID